MVMKLNSHNNKQRQTRIGISHQVNVHLRLVVTIKHRMKKFTLLLFFLPLISYTQDKIDVSKEEKDFALKVVKSIIENDCETYYNSINDSVVLYFRVEEILIPKSEIENKLKMLCQISVKNDSLDYSYYLENFELQFFNVTSLADKEFYGSREQSSTLGGLKHYDIQEGDIFFIGSNHKTRNHLDFILDDAFKFIIRKVKGEYKIILMTN